MVMVLNDVVMPSCVIAAGLQGKSIRRNTRTMTQTGYMQANVIWARTLRRYEIGVTPMLITDWAAVEGLFEVTEGGAFGFLLSDPKDSKATEAQGRASLVTGTTYQLQKRYTSIGSTRTKDRKITRPSSTGFVLKASGVVVGSYTLDPLTGTVIIPSAPAAATITWSGSFYVPVQFESDELDFSLVRPGDYDERLVRGESISLVEVME